MTLKSNIFARSRRLKRYFYSLVANLMFVGLLLAAGIFYFGILAGVYALYQGHGPASLVIMLCFWLAKHARAKGVVYRRRALGFAQPSAEEVFANVGRNSRKFALFLRGFDAEHQSLTYSGAGMVDEISFAEAELSARPFEAVLTKMLDKDMPLIALSNPEEAAPMSGAYRFEKIPTDWEQFLVELLPDAFPVFMYVTSWTAGLQRELWLIRNSSQEETTVSNHREKTIIVISRRLATKNDPRGKNIRATLSEYPHVIFEQQGREWSRKHERLFYGRLRRRLRLLEENTQGGHIISNTNPANFPLSTPRRFNFLLAFFKGPALLSAAYVGLAVFIVTVAIFCSGDFRELISLQLVLRSPVLLLYLALLWVSLTVVLSLVKGAPLLLGILFLGISEALRRLKDKLIPHKQY
jgi:hypothetical protein